MSFTYRDSKLVIPDLTGPVIDHNEIITPHHSSHAGIETGGVQAMCTIRKLVKMNVAACIGSEYRLILCGVPAIDREGGTVIADKDPYAWYIVGMVHHLCIQRSISGDHAPLVIFFTAAESDQHRQQNKTGKTFFHLYMNASGHGLFFDD